MPQKKTLSKVKAVAWRKLKESERAKVLFLQPEELSPYLDEATAQVSKDARQPRLDSEAAEAVTSAEVWQERVWHALKHLDDRSVLDQSPLARLAYIQRLAEREYRGNILVGGASCQRGVH